VVLKNPIILVPSLIPMVIALLFEFLARWVFAQQYIIYGAIISTPNIMLLTLGSFIAGILGFIAECMVIDMANDVFSQRKPDLSRSFRLVMDRIATLIALAIIAAILTVIIIGIPIAYFLAIVAIVEGVGVGESLSRAVSFVSKNLGSVIVFIIIVIVVVIILSLIPVVGSILNWIASITFTVAAVNLYISLKTPPLPPPPPELPPPPEG
jgi:hypothetical protein